MTDQPIYYEDEIDVRELLENLLKYKWWIIGTAVLFGVAAILVVRLLLPKTYNATSFVVITKPSLTANLDSRIESSPQIPDARSLTDLTKADDLVLLVYEEVGAPSSNPESVSLVSLKSQLNPSLVGINQLRLEVTDIDPDRAAEIANVWAEKTAARLNLLFGSDVESLLKLEEQTSEARKNWDSSHQALIEYLPESDADSLQVGLTQAREALKLIINEIDNINLLLSDLNAMQSRLNQQNTNKPLALDELLGLISLQQQAVGQLEGLQIQVASQDIQEDGYTVDEARIAVDTLIQSLQEQRAELLSSKKSKEADISALAADLEQAQYKVSQLTVQRDLDLRAYQALSAHMEELQITLFQNDQAAKVAGLALPPINPSGPRALFVGAAAGAAGFTLAVFFVLMINWWKSTNNNE